jgi:hypothetical protein
VAVEAPERESFPEREGSPVLEGSIFRSRPLLAAIAVALALSAALIFGQRSPGATVPATYTASLTGAAEVPPVTTSATGSFSATVTGNTMQFQLMASGTDLTMAHIHLGAAGANGPIVAWLFGPVAGVNSINESGTIAASDLVGPLAGDFAGFLEALHTGQLYVNVHSVANPGGEVRGQIAIQSSIDISLVGWQEVPPVTTSATGGFEASFGGGESLNFTLMADGTALTMAHIHLGGVGVNGPIVMWLFDGRPNGVSHIHQTGTITPDDLEGPLAGDWAGFVEAWLAGNLYVNVHSVANPGGEIRGQITTQQVPTPTATTPASPTSTATVPAATSTATVPPATATPGPPATGQGTAADDGIATPLLLALLGLAAATAAGGGLALAHRRS